MAVTILTIDDSKPLRIFVERTLSAFDCEANESNNGFNGFFAIERARPDLILLDVVMPVMGGLEMLERLKASPELKAIPVIMLPSPGDHAYMEEIKTLGADDFLMKPFTAEALLEKIRSFVTLKARK
ncbi:response regulator [Oleiharenicola lentus]|uniref:response regulator n=1 Tax=Oleiharenicola lentus TaxID=2508720 RepID=UPI003F68012D